MINQSPVAMCTPNAHNVTFFCLTGGQCVNASDVCDGVDHCVDGSDESFTHAYCYDVYLLSSPDRRLSILEIGVVIIGCVVAIAIICCLFGTAVDCFLHIYRYWCPSCVHKSCDRRRSSGSGSGSNRPRDDILPINNPPAAAATAATAATAPTEPIVLVLKELPSNCSTIVVTCQPSPTVSSNSSCIHDDDDDLCDACGQPTTNNRSVMIPSRHVSGRRRTSVLGSRGYRPTGAACFGPLLIRPASHCISCSENQLMTSSNRSRDNFVVGLYRSHACGSVLAKSTSGCVSGETHFCRILPTAPPPSYSSICVSSWTPTKGAFTPIAFRRCDVVESKTAETIT